MLGNSSGYEERKGRTYGLEVISAGGCFQESLKASAGSVAVAKQDGGSPVR